MKNSLTHEQIRMFNTDNTDLENKVILVTGAGDGIGAQAVASYVACGALVILLGRTRKKLQRVQEKVNAEKSADCQGSAELIIPLCLEEASMVDMQGVATLIQTQYGRLDGVLHSASQLGQLMPLADYPLADLERIMRVNFQSNFMLTKALLPLMLQTQNASVVFTTSSVGSKPRALWGAYALSKQCTEGMSEIFTQEHAEQSIRFNCINPGGTRTNMRASAYPEEDPMTLKTPLDIMPTYVCLMSSASIGIRGQVIDCQPK